MRGAVICAPGDVRVEQREDPKIIQPADAAIRLATHHLRVRLEPVGLARHQPGHRAAPDGTRVCRRRRRDRQRGEERSAWRFAVGSFFASDGTCEICQAGYQSRCAHLQYAGAGRAQAEYLRVPLADGTLVATHGRPDAELVPSLLAASGVLGTGWFGAVAADVRPGKTVAVVGDGAVGLLGVLAARHLGAERIAP